MTPPVALAHSEIAAHPSIMIVSGEASGDLHGAKLAEALTALDGRLSLFGVGGARMRAAGVQVGVDARQLAVVGITEITAKLPAILKGWRAACRMLEDSRPDLLILIEFPDFNLRLARFAKRMGTKVLYYISPQIWAWRRRRVRQIRRRVDHMAVILPFEVDFYRRHDVPVSFVGHPLMDQPRKAGGDGTKARCGTSLTVGLLPGSRDSELGRLLLPMLGAARHLQKRLGVRILLSRADSVDPRLMDRLAAPFQGRLEMDIVDGCPESVFQDADLLIVASGTVTLEAALYGTPMIIVYRVSPLSYLLGKALIRVPHIGLVNLIAGRRVAPELIQQTVTPAAIAAEAQALLTQPQRRARMREALDHVRRRLGKAGASERVARIALGMLGPAAEPAPDPELNGIRDQCP